jgi:hypothetical protein
VWCRRPISPRKSRAAPQSVVDALIVVGVAGASLGGSDRRNPHGCYLIAAEASASVVFAPSVSGCWCVGFCGSTKKTTTKNWKMIAFFSGRDGVTENAISNG